MILPLQFLGDSTTPLETRRDLEIRASLRSKRFREVLRVFRCFNTQKLSGQTQNANGNTCVTD